MSIVFQVIATHRNNLTEHCIAMRSSPEAARKISIQCIKDLQTQYIRVYTKPVSMTTNDIIQVIIQWGKDDANNGEPRPGLEQWPPQWMEAYQQGYNTHSIQLP
jgi:hypothetical protein